MKNDTQVSIGERTNKSSPEDKGDAVKKCPWHLPKSQMCAFLELVSYYRC